MSRLSKLVVSMNIAYLLFIILLSAVTAGIAATSVVAHRNSGTQIERETAFSRIMRTNTIRCGYGIWEPGLMKDPQTGQLTGIFHDYMEAIGQHTGLKIDWTEEVGWGDFPAALSSGRIDAMCFGAWPKASVARQVLFTKPIYFLPINAYARTGDNQFDHAIDKANHAAVTLSVMDSELSSELARTRFPQAKTISVPQTSDASVLLLNVADGKADLTFTDAWHGAAFMAANPGKLKQVPLDQPLRLFGHTAPVAQNEEALVSLLNTVTDELLADGEIDAIVRKYDKGTGGLLMPETAYRAPQGK